MNDTPQAKCKRVLRWLRNERKEMSTNQIGGNPAVNQQGQPIGQTTELTTSPIVGGALAKMDIPEFMLGLPKEELGTELMKQYVSPPRMKIVQGQSQQELKRLFPESSVVITPEMIGVTGAIDFRNGQEESDFIRVVPVFFYTEYCLFNPMGVKPYCRERSIDAQSKLAIRCKGQIDKRSMPCPEDLSKLCKYQEVFNFILYVWNPDVYKDPVLLSLKSSDFVCGKEWCRLACIPRGVPCYGQVFELNCSPRKKDDNNWYGWNVRHAITEQGMIEFVRNEEWFNHLREVHAQFVDNYRADELRANYDDELPADDANTVQTSASNVPM